MRFLFRGRDLKSLSSSDAMGQDWNMISANLASAIAHADELDDRSHWRRTR